MKESSTIILIGLLLMTLSNAAAQQITVNVKNCGASSDSSDSQAAIHEAIEVCSRSGGGTVYLPPGSYTSGTISLSSHVRLFWEAGAILRASRDRNAFKKHALIYGENLENISIEGKGLIDGQAEYEWQAEDASKKLADGVPKDFNPLIKRPYPIAPTPKMILLINCRNIQIKGISIRNSPSWTIHLWGCENVRIHGITIENSLKEGVWTDGINPDCCKDVHITDCTITAGDDAIAVKTTKRKGKVKPCENITVSNCRLTSASCGIKVGTETNADIRHVVVNNCIIRDSNRGIGIIVRDSATVSDIIFSNLTIECSRHDYFWWGNADPIFFVSWKRQKVVNPGTIKNVLVTDIIAHAKGTSLIEGLSGVPLAGITLNNIKFVICSDSALDFSESSSPFTYEHFYHTKIFPIANEGYQKYGVYGLKCNNIRGLNLKDIEIIWEAKVAEKWNSALYCENISDLTLENFVGRQPHVDATAKSAVILKNINGATISGCCALHDTGTFIQFTGQFAKNVCLIGNNFLNARIPYTIEKPILKSEIKEMNNIFHD